MNRLVCEMSKNSQGDVKLLVLSDEESKTYKIFSLQ